MKKFIIAISLFSTLCSTGCAQSNSQKNGASPVKSDAKVGGSCEGCEAIYESPVSFDKLSWIDTLPGFNDKGPKLEVSGTVYMADGKTPAKDVVIYIYHTDQEGRYPTLGNEKGWGKRHGYIRGWMKTNKEGKYKFYTLRPAPYPGRSDAAHIHPVIKEEGKSEYYIDAYLFDDDALLTGKMRNGLENRGGDGILKPRERGGIWYAERDIYLGKNIPDYPTERLKNIQSGLSVGSDCPAFDPLHISGADVGKKACPMCKYGFGQGVMIWVNDANLNGMNEFVERLEKEMLKRGENIFRAFLIYMNPDKSKLNTTDEIVAQQNIKNWCERQKLKKVAVLWVPSPADPKTSGLYNINTAATNTVLLYKKRVVAAKWVNIDYTEEALFKIIETL